MKCPTCGYELNGTQSVCPNCGAGMEDDSILQATGASGEEGWNSKEESFGGENPEQPEAVPAEEEPVVSSIPGDDDLPPEKKRRKWPIILVIVLLAAALIAIFAVRYYKKHFIAHEIHLGTNALELIVGDTNQLTYEILPETTKNKTVTWATTDEAVASVDENGLVTALGSGNCEITVTTNNGITDACSVNVKDLIDIQKESVDAVAAYVKANSTEGEGGDPVAKIRDIDEEHSFAIGTMDEDLVLCYRDAVNMDSVDVDVNYTTYLNLGYGNIETAEIVQDNQVEVFGYPVKATMKSAISLAEYQRGAAVTVDSFESNLEGMEVNPSMQKMFNNGVKGCFEEFRSFLEYHPELGCSIEDFGFTAVGDAPVEEEPEEEPETWSMAESMAESVVESIPEAAESRVTIVEEIAEPAGTESAASVAEAAGETAPAAPAGGLAETETEDTASAAMSVVESAEVSGMAAEAAAGAAAVMGEAEAAVEAAAEAAAESAGAVAEALESAAGEVTEEADAAARGAEVLQSAAEEVTEEADAAAAGAAEALESAAEEVTEEADAAAAGAAEALESAAEEVTEEADAAAAGAAEALESAAEEVTEEADAAAAGTAEALESAAEEVTEETDAIFGGVESTVENAAEEAAALAGAAGAAVESTVESIAEDVQEGAAGVVQAAGDALEQAESVVESVAEEIAEPVTDLFSDGDDPSQSASGTEILQSLTESLSGDSGRLFPPSFAVMC